MSKQVFTVKHGDCLDVLRSMPDASVDSIVSDPPYGLAFMGAKWDYDVPSVDIWRECLRVLKAGGHLLAFGGTRTYHRMVVNIEDAGLEIRDQLQWLYGCLSEDTEVLTEEGWEHYHTAIGKEILTYDVEADIYKWEKPERWSSYRVEQDTAYRIESALTDQIVSRNHRCLVERGGSLCFVEAENCSSVESVPTLPDDLCPLQEKDSGLLREEVQRALQGAGLGEARPQRQGGLDAEEYRELPQENVWERKPRMERWADVPQKEGRVCESVDKVCSLSKPVRVDGAKGRLCDGASAVGGGGDRATAIEERMRPPYQSRRDRQSDREPDALCVELRSQAVRARPTYRASLATITEVEYTGTIFCPTVSTGAFVARRNGKVFVTGNSGFPKSLDVSKAIDRTAGAEREVVATEMRYNEASGIVNAGRDERVLIERNITAPATDEAKQWEGWGTALKPANEPICLARKPIEGTVAENVLKHGTGALNVDGCRVESEGEDTTTRHSSSSSYMTGKIGEVQAKQAPYVTGSDKGRWPANVIHDGSECVVSGFPDTGPSRKGVRILEGKENRVNPSGWKEVNRTSGAVVGHSDEGGSAARFFYCAKPSKAERDKGLEGFDVAKCGSLSGRQDGSLGGGIPMGRNVHPTVKPVDLMRWLCRLITPPSGLVLDPFAGSGTTGVAAMLEGFNFVGVEREAEYVEIARARIADAVPHPTLF